jgi:UPF0755 protein
MSSSKPSKRPFRIALLVVAGTVAILLGVAGYFLYSALHYPDERNPGKGAIVDVEVKPGMSFPQVASLLSRHGVIEKPTWFRLYAMWRGDTTNVKQGKYALPDNLTPREVLDKLVAGVEEKTVNVQLPPGENMLEYFAKLEAAGVAPAAELEAVARDPAFLTAHAIAGDTVEGYLFPDTYNFRLGDDPKRVLEKPIRRFQDQWNQLARANPKSIARLKDRLKWTERDILVMASIVEKEAIEPGEQPRIAQVFINRLSDPQFSPKRLETDPTIRYGCLVPRQKSAACTAWLATCQPDPASPSAPPLCPALKSAQLNDKDNVYNTYEHDFLPPGPIGNPGAGAIRAVLDPDGSNYFYFVAKNDREHAFARSYDEHKKNVEKYLAWRRNQP